MDTKNLIKKAFKYKDEKTEKYELISSKIDNYEFTNSKLDLQEPEVKWKDKNNKTLFNSKWQLAGSYLPEFKMWIWSWADPTSPKNTQYISRDLLKYGLDIDVNESNEYDKLIKMILTNSRFMINSFESLDLFSCIILYLSKKEFIFQKTNNNFIDFYFIYDIN